MAALRQFLNQRPVCSLCLGWIDGPGYIGFFIPKPEFAKRIGQPKGKQRVIGYKLCDACYERPERDQALDAGILRQFEVQ